MEQRAHAQPFEELVAIRCVEDIVERIAPAPALDALRDAQQMEIVIAEHRDGCIAERFHVAQAIGRPRPAIHEVADEPQLVARRIECDLIDEPAQRLEAALQVSDRVGGQRYFAAPTM